VPTPKLSDTLTDEECREILRLWVKHGEKRAAAAEAGMDESAFARRLEVARSRETSDGYKVKGTSTLYDAQTGEAKLQWVKTDADQERQQSLFKEAIAALAKTLPRVTIKPPKSATDDLMAIYPIADHHHGALSWGKETGADYDVKISQKLLMGAFDYLVDCAPSCKRGAVIFGGDFFHYDGTIPETPTHKFKLDADSRFQEMVETGVALARYAVERPAQKHEELDVFVLPGNHDPYSAVFLAIALGNIYENNPRIRINLSPRLYQYLQFGKCLVGLHHGHKTKMASLPLLMATDMPEAWGETMYRYYWTFHVHHDQVGKDNPGCKVESFRVLAAPDAFAEQEGYRALRDMKAIVLHKEFGEVTRHIVNPRMLE
jgi:hypothetical protein